MTDQTTTKPDATISAGHFAIGPSPCALCGSRAHIERDCDASEVTATTTPDPEWLTSLRRDMQGEVRDVAILTEVSDSEEIRMVADRATGLAASYLHQVHADLRNAHSRIAELEADVRALGGDPDRMVDPRDHEAAIKAMRVAMHGGGRMGSRVGVNDACDIAEEHMLRMAQASLGASKDGRAHCPRCDSPNPKKHPAVQFEGEVHICPDPFHAPDKLDDDSSDDSVLALIEGILSSPILTSDAARLYGVEMALESRRPLTSAEIAHAQSLATPRPEVRQVPAGEAREGDTVTIVGRYREAVGLGDGSAYVECRGVGPFHISDDAFSLTEPMITVSRPVSPLPDQPGAVIRATSCLFEGVRVLERLDKVKYQAGCWAVPGEAGFWDGGDLDLVGVLYVPAGAAETKAGCS